MLKKGERNITKANVDNDFKTKSTNFQQTYSPRYDHNHLSKTSTNNALSWLVCFSMFLLTVNLCGIRNIKNSSSSTYHVMQQLERLRNENEDKTKTRMTQSFNQYSENETKIWRQNILNQFNRVSSSCLRSHFVISLLPSRTQHALKPYADIHSNHTANKRLNAQFLNGHKHV